MTKYMIGAFMLAFSVTASATTCYSNGDGTIECPDSGANVAPQADPSIIAADRLERAKKEQQAKLTQCLRTADWPNQPSRSECEQMYGGN